MPAMSTMKRPAAKSQSSKGMKRPAASQEGSLNRTIDRMSKVSKLDRDADEHADDDDEHEGEGRDKSKGQKYQKMKGQLPEHVVDLIEKESQRASSPREFKTMIINRLYKRNSAGKLVLNLDDHLFTEHKKVFTKKYSNEKETALPEGIMRGLYFNNSQVAMDQAKKDGDIVAVDVGNGKTFWAFQSYVKGQESGKLEEQTINQNKKISKDQHQLLQGAFASVDWEWNYVDKDVKALADGNKIPPAILNIVSQATDSQTKLMKEAMTMIKGWKGDKDSENLVLLKKGHAKCNQNLAQLQHMKEFHELPGDLDPSRANIDKVMLEMATHTKQYNELVETCRGLARAAKK